MNTTQLEKFFERSKSEMEGQREFQTNHQDGNNVVTDGTRNTAKEDINLSLAEVRSFLAHNKGQSGNHLILTSGNDSSRQVQPVNSSVNAAYPSPKPSTGDELSTEEDETLEVSLAPQNDQVFKRGQTEHAIQGSRTKPPEEVAEEGPSQSSEVPNKMVMSSSAKPSTSEEESEKGKSLQNQRPPYEIPSLQCVTCHNMVSMVIHSFLKQPTFLPDCSRMFMIQWGPFCQSCGEPFPALLIKDILSQNVERKGCERLDGIEDRVGDRDGRDEGGGQDRSDGEKQQHNNIRLAIQGEFDQSVILG